MADKKPDNSLSDTLQSLRDVLARFPDVVAASLSNAFSRSPAPAADGVSQPQDPGLFRSAASFFEPLMRRFARPEPPATPFSPTRFAPAQADFGKVDWGEVLARHAPAHMQRGGVVGSASFGSGDVMEEVRRQRAERDALRASYNVSLGAGYKPYSHAKELAAAFAKATVVGGMGPGASAAGSMKPGPPVPHVGRRDRLWADMAASWRSMAANFRYFTKHPGHVASGMASRFAASNFGQMLGRGNANFQSFRAAPFLNTARGARNIGRAAFASMRGAHRRVSRAAQAFQRRARIVHRKASRASKRAGGGPAGAAAYANVFAGPRFGPLAGGVAGAASLATAIGSAVVTAVDRARAFAENQTDNNRRFASVNPLAAHAYAQLGIGDFHRTVQTGRENEGTVARLARTVDSMRDAFRPLDSLTTAIGNRAALAASNTTSSFMRAINPIIEGIRGGIEAIDPNGEATSGIVNRAARFGHGALGFAGNLALNAVTLGAYHWLGGGSNPVQAFNNWSQAEYDAQVKAAQGKPDPVWNGLVAMAWPEQRVFLPPRKVVKP